MSRSRGLALVAPKSSLQETLIYAEILVTLYTNGQIELDAHYVVSQAIRPRDWPVAPDQVGAISKEATVGSPDEQAAIEEIKNRLSHALDRALAEFVRRSES